MDKTAAELTLAARERIKPKNFALPKQEKYPIHDLPHARNALARAAQHAGPGQKATIRSKVYTKFPGLADRAKEASVKIAQAPMDVGAAVDEAQRQRGIRILKNMGGGAAIGVPAGAGIGALVGALGGGRMSEVVPAGATIGGLAGLYGGMIRGAMKKTPRAHAMESAERASSRKKQASLDLPEEVEKMAAAIALGVTLAEEDLIGMRKEAMEIAVRMMAKQGQAPVDLTVPMQIRGQLPPASPADFASQVAGMGGQYASGPSVGVGRGDVAGDVAGVTPEEAPSRMDLGTADVLRAVEPSPGAQPLTGNLATLLGGGPPASMVAGVGPGPVSQAGEAVKVTGGESPEKVQGQAGPAAEPTMVFNPGVQGVTITPGAGVTQLSPEEISALPPGVTGISPQYNMPMHASQSYAPPKGMEVNAALHAAIDRERAISLRLLEKAGSLEKRALSMSDISGWIGARGQEAQSTAQSILNWAKANPEAAGAIAGGAGGAGVGALAAGKGKRGKGALLGGTIGGLGGLVAGHALGHRGGEAPKAQAPEAPKPELPRTPAAPPRSLAGGASPQTAYEQIAQRAEQATAAQQAEAARAYEEIARRAEAADAARQAQGAASYAQVGERAERAGRAARTLQGQRELRAQLAEFLASQGR